MDTLMVFGSSIARDLSEFDKKRVHRIRGRKVKIIYRAFPGKSFEYFLAPENRWQIAHVLRCRPTYVCVMFGGNSIKMGINWEDVLVSCREFYRLLYDAYMAVKPDGLIIASQILLRFNRNPKNKYQCPDPDTFKAFRNLINRKINKLKTKHHMLIIAGPKNLDQEYWFRDGTHLRWAGQRRQFAILRRTLGHIMWSRAQAIF